MVEATVERTKPMGVGRILWITIVTVMFPGFGQALFSRRVAVTWFVAMLVAFASMLFVAHGVYVMLALWAGNFIDVVVRLVRGRTKALPHPKFNVPVVFLVANVVLVGGLQTQFQSFKHPSSSMAPTIGVGDRTMVNTLSAKLGAPERGDVIVFQQPCDRRRMYAKRVVAIAGDTVEVRCQRLILNGKAVPMELVQHDASYEDFDGERMRAMSTSQYRETIAGRTFEIFHSAPGLSDDLSNAHDFPDVEGTSPSCSLDGDSNPDQPNGTIVETPGAADACAPTRHFVVPPDSLFVMGDNRDNSNDSRYWGVVPTSYVTGRIVGVFWPLGRLRNF